jgi:putative Holliday junction resolvase
MRYIAFDLGDRRTGIATGDSVTGLAGPVGILEVSINARGGDDLLDAVAGAVQEQLGEPPREQGPPRGQIVIGLPVNMDGSEGPRAKVVRAFSERIAHRTGYAVHLQDERLSSSDADWAMARSGLTRQQKKQRRDALAAAAILRDFLLRIQAERRSEAS